MCTWQMVLEKWDVNMNRRAESLLHIYILSLPTIPRYKRFFRASPFDNALTFRYVVRVFVSPYLQEFRRHNDARRRVEHEADRIQGR
jgi:hypothetical protein